MESKKPACIYLNSYYTSCVSILLISGAGVGEVEVVIMDPTGKKNTVTCTIEDKGNSSYRCTYKPTLEGQHIVYVTFAGGAINKSPFTVNVGEGKTVLLRSSSTFNPSGDPFLLQQHYKSFYKGCYSDILYFLMFNSLPINHLNYIYRSLESQPIMTINCNQIHCDS